MVIPRTSQEVTPGEIQTFQKFCADHDIVTDGPAGEQNANALGDYIIDAWKVEITEDTLDVALDKLRDRIVLYTPAQAKYKKIASEDQTRATKLIQWFNSPANKSLVKDGDEGLENQAALLAELRGREITPKAIFDAIGRASTKGGIHFAPTEHKVDPRQHQDTTPFAPKEDNRKFVGGKLNHAFKEPDTQQATSTNTPVDAWESMTKTLLGYGSHSQQAALRQTYDQAVAQGKSWREVYSDLNKLRASYDRVMSRGF